ncbi:MAG: gamma-glutamyl-gamma-aminobutyrate hydrolase family protein [Desulfomonilaceae bacterium]|jgi:GMP synthase (glutamine-hydrolysing)
MKKALILLLIGLNLIFAFDYSTCRSDIIEAASIAQTTQNSANGDATSLWIVVNLFTGRTSRQAVKVQETMKRLGAEGSGIVLPYSDITIENMKKLRPAFLVLSPNGIPWCRYKGKNGEDLANFFKALPVIIEDMRIPVIGICGGHQALALAFGGKVGPIRGGEDDCFPYGHNPTEKGRRDINVLHKDPLFSGMDKSLNLVESHYDEVKRLPKGFIALGQNELCPYQIIRHPDRPAYGVQAHTEYFMNSRPDGGILLRNFLDIARTHNSSARHIDEEASMLSQVERLGLGNFRTTFW